MVTKKAIEELLLEGLHSGEPIKTTPEMWEELRRKLRERRATTTFHSAACARSNRVRSQAART